MPARVALRAARPGSPPSSRRILRASRRPRGSRPAGQARARRVEPGHQQQGGTGQDHRGVAPYGAHGSPCGAAAGISRKTARKIWRSRPFLRSTAGVPQERLAIPGELSRAWRRSLEPGEGVLAHGRGLQLQGAVLDLQALPGDLGRQTPGQGGHRLRQARPRRPCVRRARPAAAPPRRPDLRSPAAPGPAGRRRPGRRASGLPGPPRPAASHPPSAGCPGPRARGRRGRRGGPMRGSTAAARSAGSPAAARWGGAPAARRVRRPPATSRRRSTAALRRAPPGGPPRRIRPCSKPRRAPGRPRPGAGRRRRPARPRSRGGGRRRAARPCRRRRPPPARCPGRSARAATAGSLRRS